MNNKTQRSEGTRQEVEDFVQRSARRTIHEEALRRRAYAQRKAQAFKYYVFGIVCIALLLATLTLKFLFGGS